MLNQSYELGEVRDALNRMRSRTYGVCEACDYIIPVERLRAVPHARYCMPCQCDIEEEEAIAQRKSLRKDL